MSAPRIIPGPLTSKVSRRQAEDGLKSHPDFPKGASYTLQEVEGRWVAAIQMAAGAMPFAPEQEAGGPPKGPGGPPDDGGGEDAPPDPEADGPPTDDEEDGPPKEKDEKGGEKKELSHIIELLTQLTTALGIAGTPMDNPAPGGEDGPPPPDGGPDGPPMGGKPHEEKPMKPGDAPPGTTPTGAPSFSNVRKDHPWTREAGVAATFSVESAIGDVPLDEVYNELRSLAGEIGYGVARFREGRNEDGKRTAAALISAYHSG